MGSTSVAVRDDPFESVSVEEILSRPRPTPSELIPRERPTSSEIAIPVEILSDIIRFIDSVRTFHHCLLLCQLVTYYVSFEDPECASHLQFTIPLEAAPTFPRQKLRRPLRSEHGHEMRHIDDVQIFVEKKVRESGDAPPLRSHPIYLTHYRRFVFRLSLLKEVEETYYKDLFGLLPNLRSLEIFRARTLKEESLMCIQRSLTNLHIDEGTLVGNLEGFLKSEKGKFLEILSLNSCSNLHTVGLEHLTNLRKLYVMNGTSCELNTEIVASFRHSLEKIVVHRASIKGHSELGEGFYALFPNLQVLELRGASFRSNQLHGLLDVASRFRKLTIWNACEETDTEIRRILGREWFENTSHEFIFRPAIVYIPTGGMGSIDDRDDYWVLGLDNKRY